MVRPPNRRVRPPESEVILGLEAGDSRIRHREVHEGKDPGRPPRIDVVPAKDTVGDPTPDEELVEPEERRLGLIRCPRLAVEAAKRLDRVEIAGVGPAPKREGARKPMLGQVDAERLEAPPPGEERNGAERRRIERRREVVVPGLAARSIDRLGYRSLLRRPRAYGNAVPGPSRQVRLRGSPAEGQAIVLGRTGARAATYSVSIFSRRLGDSATRTS